MTSKITYIKEPRWANLENTAIDCIVKFEHLKIEVPYTSIKNGSGTEKFIFDECASGKYGYILPYQSSNQQQESVNIEILPEPLQSKLNKFMSLIDEANKENNSGSFRAVATAYGAILEQSIIDILENINVTKPKDFNEAIKIGYQQKIYDKSMEIRLHTIRKIRNICAHATKISLESYDNDPNKNLEFYLRKLYDKDHQELFHYKSDLEYLWPIVFNGSCIIAKRQLLGIYLK